MSTKQIKKPINSTIHAMIVVICALVVYHIEVRFKAISNTISIKRLIADYHHMSNTDHLKTTHDLGGPGIEIFTKFSRLLTYLLFS